MNEYIVRQVSLPPPADASWDHPIWEEAQTANVDRFHPQSSDHRPTTRVRLLFDNEGMYAHFRVADRYVRAVAIQPQSPVCLDSCVEFFVEPKPGAGYFNFEVNCIGTILLRHVTDPRRLDGGALAKAEPVAPDLLRRLSIFHTLQGPIVEEIPGPIEWRVAYHVPFALFERYVGTIGSPAGGVWRGNFYKCGDRTSHPHWASWASIGEKLNFHVPEHFAPLRFAPSA